MFSLIKVKLRVLVIIMAMSMMFASIGCPKKPNITNIPPGITQTEVQDWYIATGALQTIADATNKSLDLVISLNRSGLFPDSPAYKQTIQSFKAIGQAGLDTKNALANAPQQFQQPQKDQLNTFVNNVSTELQKLTNSGLVGIKDENSKKNITTLISLINNSLQMINTLR